MKLRNDYLRHIVKLSEQLPPLTDKQRQWAINHCFAEDAFYSAGKAWCLHCGEIFDHKASKLAVGISEASAICPNCGRELQLQYSRKNKYNQRVYFTIMTTHKGYQAFRHFIIEKTICKTTKYPNTSKAPMYFVDECVQNWIDDNGKETIIARSVRPMSFYYDAWNFRKPMSLKEHNIYSCASQRYDINTDFVYPISRILPKIARNGFFKSYKRISYSEQAKLLLRDKEAEILAKNKQWDLFGFKWNRNYGEFCFPYQHSIRVAIRHKYIVKDASMWFDYLDLLGYFGKDTHNPHYVCPADLKVEHDRLYRKKTKIEAQRRLKEQIEQARQWEADYQKNKGKYFGICFGNEDIIVSVIQSVSEMAEEGETMHHCVFENRYFEKPASLIMSAKDKAGNRIETIEVDLNTFKVIQSRGVCNKNTDYHDAIIELVNNNMNLIRKIT